MHYNFRNVNDAFTTLVRHIHNGTIPMIIRASRYGEMMYVEEPVIISYAAPTERVLFNAARDCNPFFHLYEALWMLDGRNDLAPLAYYNKRMSEFSDDGLTFNGGYGRRWRNALTREPERMMPGSEELDQLDFIITHLRKNPHSRRAVLNMWNVEDDLLKIGGVCTCGADRTGPSAEAHDSTCPAVTGSKDVCCNLNAVFRVVLGDCRVCRGTGGLVSEQEGPRGNLVCPRCNGMPHEVPHSLDMTVFNRSNDLVWGLCGANAVHFSILLEYMAARLGLAVGTYHQVTSDLHAYAANWRPVDWLQGTDPTRLTMWDKAPAAYGDGMNAMPLVKDPAQFDKELPDLVWRHRDGGQFGGNYAEPFLANTAQPLFIAFHHYRAGNLHDALRVAHTIEAPDWQYAAAQWLLRRKEKKEAAK